MTIIITIAGLAVLALVLRLTTPKADRVDDWVDTFIGPGVGMPQYTVDNLLLISRIHFGVWWLFWADGLTIGRHIFIRRHTCTIGLIRHELMHVRQYRAAPGNWSTCIPIFWCIYAWQWVCSAWTTMGRILRGELPLRRFWRTAYREMPYEREAYAAMEDAS